MGSGLRSFGCRLELGAQSLEPGAQSLRLYLRNADARQHAAVSAGLAKALAPLLLEHAQLRTSRLAVDHADDLGVGDERRPGDDVARVLLDEQHLVERELGAMLSRSSVDFDDRAGRHLELPATCLNNRVHERYLSRDWMIAGRRPASPHK